MRWFVNHWHEATIGRHSLSQPYRAASSLREGAWMGAFPAPSMRELSSECETEGVYSGERNRSKISEPICAGV